MQKEGLDVNNEEILDSYLNTHTHEEEIRYYLKFAAEKTNYPNMNFDLIFKPVKTIFKQYVVVDDHHISLLVSDIIYSYSKMILRLLTMSSVWVIMVQVRIPYL
jgi:hypothetical protein